MDIAISSYTVTMTGVVKVVIISVIVWVCHSVAAQEKVCSSFCSTLGMLQSSPGKSCNDIFQIKRLAEEYLVTTGSTLLLVYTKCIVIWNWSVVVTREVG